MSNLIGEGAHVDVIEQILANEEASELIFGES
jgi:hypothetical protein